MASPCPSLSISSLSCLHSSPPPSHSLTAQNSVLRAMVKRAWCRGGIWRMMSPFYCLSNPDRLAFIFTFYVLTFFLCTGILVWDRKETTHNKQQVGIENVPTNFGVKVEGKMLYPDDNDHLTRERRDKVKDAMIHAWSAYEKYAWGYDELRPESQEGENSFGGLGATIIDSLDTLYIMGLHKQFQRAKDWVASKLDFNKNYDASVFETTIRILGGLLSAYDLSNEKIFLDKARDLANRLLPAWNTQTGIPYTTINLAHGTATNPSWNGGSSVLADLGSEQLEFVALSQRTGNPIYMKKVENVINVLRKTFPSDGLLGIYISPVTGRQTTSKVTFGGMGDSFYEYLLKVWIQGNKTQPVEHYRGMWEQSMEGLMTLIKKSTPSTFTYIAERSTGNTLTDKMEELACFAPGMLALGSEDGTPAKKSKYLKLAKELVRTCYQFYQLTPTKLAGETYYFTQGKDMNVDTASNILRPETVESLMYLWRKTGDNVYRDWGWNIFQAFESYCRTKFGYVGLQDVNTGAKDNKMQSFFLAETLKYLYLLFSPSTVIPLDQWVFNTEAHPLRIISRAEGSIDLKQTAEVKERELDLPKIQDRRLGWTWHEE